MATVLYQFEEKQKTEGITDLSLYTDPINFDAREPNLINEEDDDVSQHTSSAILYQELMKDIVTKKYQSKADLAMIFTHAQQWLNGENSWLTFIAVLSLLVILLIPLIMYILYKFFGFKFQFQKVNSILARLLVIGKSPEIIKTVTVSDTMTNLETTKNPYSAFSPHQMDFKLLQIVLFIVLSLATTCLI